MSHALENEYRPDIDGLRALAVMFAVIFHAFPNLLTGGFIGVDIFFVISGFLITKIIFQSLETGTFSILDFYNRRIKRIFPALTIVMIVSLILGWFFLFFDEYAQLGKHIRGGLLFVSNIYFYQEVGYFDTLAETKPMLHLWSLAVEEQFYIFWPILLALVWKRRWNFVVTIALVAGLTFILNIYLVQKNPSAAFYLSIPRFWELLIGAFLAYLSINKRSIPFLHPEVSSVLGCALIFSGVSLLNVTSAFPGWWALLPTLGTFFLIYAGSNAFLNKYLFSNPIMVWFGLISYPLYLWHWPLLSYLRIVTGDTPDPLHTVVAVILAIFLAWLTYFFLERKVRPSKGYRAAIYLLALAAIILMSISWMRSKGGLPDRPVNQQIDYLSTLGAYNQSRQSDQSCSTLNGLSLLKEEVCLSNSAAPKTLFVGDSHAMSLYSGVFTKKVTVDAMLIGAHACKFYPNLSYTPTYQYNFANNCTAISQKVIDLAQTINSLQKIVLVNYYPYVNGTAQSPSSYFDGGRELNQGEAFLLGQGYLIEKLLAAGKEVVFVIDVPELKRNPKDCVMRSSFTAVKSCESTMAELDASRSIYMDAVGQLKKKYPQLQIFDPTAIFCFDAVCHYKEGNQLLYNDQNHLSLIGASKVLEEMKSQKIIGK